MKCVSMWQPHAQLVAVGAKGLETRSWKTKYRGPLAIHAALKYPRELEALAWDEPFKTALWSTGFNSPALLPTGAIVAVVELTAVFACVLDGVIWRDSPHAHLTRTWGRVPVESPELEFGNFRQGRWAWELKDAKRLTEPVPFKGRQGLFEVPDELVMNAV